MKYSLRNLVLAGALCAVVGAPTHALVQASSTYTHGGKVGIRRITPLTPPSTQDSAIIIAGHLRQLGVPEAVITSLIVARSSTSRLNVRLVTMSQQAFGLPIEGMYLKAALTENGELLHVMYRLSAISDIRPAQIDERAALERGLHRLYPELQAEVRGIQIVGNRKIFEMGPFFHRNPEVDAILLQSDDGLLDRGWRVEIWVEETNELHHVIFDGQGKIKKVVNLTARDSYLVYETNPDVAGQILVSGPTAPGWLSGRQLSLKISGNNAIAYLDRNANDKSDRGGTVITDGDFLAVSDLSVSPTLGSNAAVSVQNLFYLNNIMHDALRRAGFDEGLGNFQKDNFDLGGKGRDPVLAEAQDGGGIDNANFATPPDDGKSPRMQMFLWSSQEEGGIQRDGALDSDLVYHEYCHGLTVRLITEMSGPLASAVGEGVSDACAFLMNGDDVIFEYATGKPLGARRAPYASYPYSYGDVSGVEEHDDGEIYAAIVWKLKELLIADGFSPTEILELMVNAMYWTTPRPSFENMRNGWMLSASLPYRDLPYPDQLIKQKLVCRAVWTAFSAFGVGPNAAGIESGDSVTVEEDFTNPMNVDC